MNMDIRGRTSCVNYVNPYVHVQRWTYGTVSVHRCTWLHQLYASKCSLLLAKGTYKLVEGKAAVGKQTYRIHMIHM